MPFTDILAVQVRQINIYVCVSHSSFGNALVPSNHMFEVTFAIFVITCGLLLFAMLIGNIQVLNTTTLSSTKICSFLTNSQFNQFL